MNTVNQKSKLMKISYYDTKSEVRLEAYTDTIVLEKSESGNAKNLVAIRFGGYPEQVRGMSEAIYGGGSITLEIEDDTFSVFNYIKQYRKEYAHDGIYAEATLIVQDEEQRTDNDGDSGGNKNTYNKPRRCYLFCEQGDSDRLFEELDKKTAVPLIPEFKNYVLSELQKRNILKPLEVISFKEKFDVWVLSLSESESNIISVINDGLKNGVIHIPGIKDVADNLFLAVSTVTQYLNQFGVMIAERIKSQFNPLFDPATESLSSEILAVNDNIKKNTGYSLYDAQLAVAEAHKRCLERSKSTLCIAECGIGKCKIGITTLHAYQQKKSQSKHFNIILCPSHMTKKWAREIEESLPNIFAVIVNSITEINKAYAAYEHDNKTCYIILTKERARDGYMKRPAAIWNERRRAFICPSCYEIIMMNLIDEGSKYKVKADQFFFRRENKDNHKCENCGSLLWTAIIPNRQTEWIKIAEYGFIHRQMAYEHLEIVKKKPTIYEKVSTIVDNPGESFPTTGAYNRFPLSTYIKYKMKGKIDGLIIDELHQYNNNSGQGDAMGELFQVAKKVVGMTATLINGYSSGIFHLLFRIAPDLMIKDGKWYDKSGDFNKEYGVTESVYEIQSADYNSNRRTSKKKVRERQLPGVSPLVYSRFLMDSAAFLSLNDMGKNLPEYEEIPVQLQMNDKVREEYQRIENQFKTILKSEKSIAKKILSSYLGLLTVYPDMPYDQKPIVHPINGENLVVPKDTSCFEELHEKDKNILDVVERKAAAGERVLVYTSWIRIDTQEKLLKLFTENGYQASILNASIPPNRREEWVEKQVQSGIQVLITNPSLIETGLDLNDFTTLYYYNISYNLFTLRQSSRRSWRINQKAPRVEVYFAYYEGTMQNRAIRLMASKLAVAGIIESNLSDEGLAAMSDCADMTTALARELTQGIKNEVEDLSAVFKKMAVLKPANDAAGQLADKSIEATAAVSNESSVVLADIVEQSVQSTEEKETSLSHEELFLLESQNKKPARATKKKAMFVYGNQLSLFDYIDVATA